MPPISKEKDPTQFSYIVELREDWLELSGILTNADASIEILRSTGIVSPESFSDVIDCLVPVALVIGQFSLDVGGDSTIRDTVRDHLGELMNDEEHGEYTTWCVGVCLSFFDNLKAEEKRFADSAIDILLDPDFHGSDEEKFEIARVMAGETDKALPIQYLQDFVPMTSVEKLESRRDLVIDDVEGFMLNFARNLAIVEDPEAHDNLKFRAAIYLEDILIPMIRMFGPRFTNLSDRASQSTWRYIGARYPEFTDNVREMQDCARSFNDPVRELLKDWLKDTEFSITSSRIKSLGSIVLKMLRKGYTSPEFVSDLVGYRLVANDEKELQYILSDLLDTFKYKDGTYKLVTEDYIIELGRQTPNDVENLNEDDTAAIVLDIQNAEVIYGILGRPEKMYPGKPKDSGFETVYVNLIVRKRIVNSLSASVEIQILTETMFANNKSSMADTASYKTKPKNHDERKSVEAIKYKARQRADLFASGKRILALKTQFRMLEYWPNLNTNLSKLYQVVSADKVLVALPRKIAEFVPNIEFSDNVRQQDIKLVVLPVGEVSEVDFKEIIATEAPDWISNDTKLDEALTLASKWHDGEKRRSGTAHYEGHVLPLTLAYYLNMAARGEKIDVDDLIVMLLHDSIEDAKEQKVKSDRRLVIRSRFGQNILDRIELQTKEILHAHQTSDEIDAIQADRLRDALRKRGDRSAKSAVTQKSIDRSGSHVGDLEIGILRSRIKPKDIRYLDNSRRHYGSLFEEVPLARALWYVTDEVFEEVRQKSSA